MKHTLKIICILLPVLLSAQVADQLININSVSDVTSMNSISTPNEGSLIYVQSNDQIYYYDGSAWQAISSSGSSADWSLSGNSIMASDFLGTTNNQDLKIRTNNIQRMVVKNDGKVGIGTDNPDGIFHVSTNHTSHNILPIMSSNNQFGIELSIGAPSSTSLTISDPAFNGFDANPSTALRADAVNSSSGTVEIWITVDFGLSPLIIESYAFRVEQNSTETPNQFRLEGSNDGVNWTSLENMHTTASQAYQWNATQIHSFTNTTAYRYYKLHCYELNNQSLIGDATDASLKIVEINFIGRSFDFTVSDEGNVGIGLSNSTEKLHVVGNILASGTITPDYVFEHYFDGESKLKPGYKFMDIKKTMEFAEKHKHLPGVLSHKDIKQQGGVILNRSVEQNLEKIEELYLHLHELNQKKDSLKAIIHQKTLAKENEKPSRK